MTSIAVIAMGEMGSGVARRLVERGARVMTSLEGRSHESGTRARSAGVEIVDDAGLVACDIFLSILPPASAAGLAVRFLPLIADAARKPIFADCNAIAPSTLHAIAEPFVRQGLPFVDGSIIGAAPKADGPGPRLYLSGPHASDLQILRDLGLDIRMLSDKLGEASALKMAYAGITKGFQALGASMVLGAWRNGVGDSFVDELSSSQPHLHASLVRDLPRMYPKAYRWVGEMDEIATFLKDEPGSAAMLSGAARLYEHIAADNAVGPSSEIIAILDDFVKRS